MLLMHHMHNKIIHSLKLIQKADVAIASQRKEYDTEAMLKHVSFNIIYCLQGWFASIVYASICVIYYLVYYVCMFYALK